jgi:hypothetical protein
MRCGQSIQIENINGRSVSIAQFKKDSFLQEKGGWHVMVTDIDTLTECDASSVIMEDAVHEGLQKLCDRLRNRGIVWSYT